MTRPYSFMSRVTILKFQYNKLSALVGQFDDIIKNTAMSINSQGQTLQMAGQQLDTISRKAGQLRGTMIDLFNGAAESGLRESIKDIIDGLNQFIMGLSKVNPHIYQFGFKMLEVVVAGKAFMGVYNMMMPVLTTIGAALMRYGIVTAVATEATAASAVASGVDATAKTVEATATLGAAGAQEKLNLAMAKNPIGLFVVALTALAGTALYQYISALGKAEKTQLDFNQAQEDEFQIAYQKASQQTQAIEYLETLKKKHKELSDAINSGNLNEQELVEARKNLGAVDEAVLILTDEKTRQQLIANGVTEEEIDLVIESATVEKNAAISKMEDQKKLTDITIQETLKRISALEKENALWLQMSGNASAGSASFLSGAAKGKGSGFEGAIGSERNRLAEQQKKATELATSIINAKGEIVALSHSSDGDSDGGGKDTNDWLQDFIDKTEAAAVAQTNLNAILQRSGAAYQAKSDFYKDSAMNLDEYNQGLKIQAGLSGKLEEQQAGLHKEANLYRQALAMLEAKQDSINTSTEEGQEAYNKIRDEMAKVGQTIDELGQSWLDLEGKQRASYGAGVEGVMSMIDSMQGLGIDTNQMELDYIETLNMENLTLAERLKYAAQYRDLVIETAEAQIDTNLAAEKAASNARIEAIQGRIDKLKEESDAEQELLDIEEARNSVAEAEQDLEEAKDKLSNVQKEKNTRIFKNGRWSYIADPQAVKDAQKGVEDAQKRVTDAREALNRKLEELDRKHREKELQAQIDAEKKKQDEMDKAAEILKKKIKEDGIKSDELLGKALEEAGITLDEGMRNMLDIVAQYCSGMISWLDALCDAERKAGFSSGVDNGDTDSELPGFARGGAIPVNMPIQAHAGEYVLNAQDVRDLGGYSGVKNVLASLNFPKPISASSINGPNFGGSVKTVDRGISIQNLTVPHIYDAAGLIRNLKQMAG